jgi:hypothetical protein
MNRLSRTLNYMEIKEIKLTGKCYTWSNSQVVPTLTHIDRSFCTPAWEDDHHQPTVHALSSLASDHCPILLMPLHSPVIKSKFRFESF